MQPFHVSRLEMVFLRKFIKCLCLKADDRMYKYKYKYKHVLLGYKERAERTMAYIVFHIENGLNWSSARALCPLDSPANSVIQIYRCSLHALSIFGWDCPCRSPVQMLLLMNSKHKDAKIQHTNENATTATSNKC